MEEKLERQERKRNTDQIDSPLVGDGDCPHTLLVDVIVTIFRWRRRGGLKRSPRRISDGEAWLIDLAVGEREPST
ncbi:hypothetical protein PR202_ga30069 [Eleusine coracana subsp. coracana]|uniref:Uncharacterized protein n=1 Tax=Eleusine coracana subsp. coracana TaxID=191504 RepID=A0AAV5DNB6_ELECO|nr:hypothetical protein PR202_ga30069 [Eleusine coracana subsp. coracana]